MQINNKKLKKKEEEKMNTPTTETIYEQLGISKEVRAFGQKTEEKLKERFEEFDRNAEYNQLKVIHAMQEKTA